MKDSVYRIWKHPNWPQLEWREDQFIQAIRTIHFKQGLLVGKACTATGKIDTQVKLSGLLSNIEQLIDTVKTDTETTAIGNSLARQLGIKISAEATLSEHSENIAKAVVDAVINIEPELSLERILEWQQNLLSESETDLRKTKQNNDAPNQVILELCGFVDWFNSSRHQKNLDPLVRAAVSHFHFSCVQPFASNNAMLTRFLTDHALAQAEPNSIPLYSLSESLLGDNENYRKQIQQGIQGDLDITLWISYFLYQLELSLDRAISEQSHNQSVLEFWQRHSDSGLLTEQVNILHYLLDNIKLSTTINATEYQRLTAVSKATATRHLADLVQKNCIEKLPGGGRSTCYRIILVGNLFSKPAST
ncbi:DUF4172 domain-containing protein [Amphritea sp. HPY]|uniref:DUF4172 domain-containing protein n=1 Tax=Amphritea sp. HPY TaxID=3421652 RepID=UPI003D7D2805